METTPTSAGGGGGRNLPDVERLVSGLGGFLAKLALRIRQGATVLAGTAAACGVVSLVLGVLAWSDSRPTLVFVALVCGAAIVAPLFVVSRLRVIGEAVSHPGEAASQARSYVSGLRSTPELDELVRQAAALQEKGGKLRLRAAYRSTRLLGSLVEAVAPDPRTQPLVAAFHPARLRGIWVAVIMSWWAGVVSALLGVVAAITLLADSIT